MKKKLYSLFALLFLFVGTGCANHTEPTNKNLTYETENKPAETENKISETEGELSETTDLLSPSKGHPSEISAASSVPEILRFVDVFGQEYETEINPAVEKHTYQPDLFSHNGNLLSYTGDAQYTYRLGVDVSHHQYEIDWEKVKAAGFDFAFIRLGYRGYGAAGNICLDKYFFQNIEAAQNAGMDVGVYFFSQAVNEDEAIEEATFVIQNLNGYELVLPVVYDPESIVDDEARTDDVSREQFTKNTIAFCQTISAAGYEPMIYCNMLWEAFNLDLEQLSAYPVWYADYESLPQTPYHFEYWQYSNTGNVDGISGAVDLNIQLIKLPEEIR